MNKNADGKKIITIFPECKNFHLVKDVGLIPYVLYKEFGFQSVILTYNNDDYSFLELDVKGVKIDFLKKYTNNRYLDVLIYLLKNTKKYDIIQFYHIDIRMLFVGVFSKLFSKKCKYHIKTDVNKNFFIALKNGFRYHLVKYLFNKYDLVTIETYNLYEKAKIMFGSKSLKYMPNGFYPEKISNTDNKQNQIITVGRIGDENKSNNILLEAFAKVSNLFPDWKLILIGEIESGFISFLNDYFSRYPFLQEKVILPGRIDDREIIDDYYSCAKIFVLTSKLEGFPLVFSEALNNNCVIVTSDIDAGYDVTDFGKVGKIFTYPDIDELAMKLEQQMVSFNNENLKNDLEALKNKFFLKNILEKQFLPFI